MTKPPAVTASATDGGSHTDCQMPLQDAWVTRARVASPCHFVDVPIDASVGDVLASRARDDGGGVAGGGGQAVLAGEVEQVHIPTGRGQSQTVPVAKGVASKERESTAACGATD